MKKRSLILSFRAESFAMAGILSRIIGIARRFLCSTLSGTKGNGYYSVAYEIYSIMLIISCYSLPLAVSKWYLPR